MIIDRQGFRAGIVVILINKENKVFWAKRVGENSWQFPQGGLLKNETSIDAMFRELYEEIGLTPQDVEIVASTKSWLRYRFPRTMIRHYTRPLCIGQKQKWYLLRLVGDENHVKFNATDKPEFEDYNWLYYWAPMMKIVNFKRGVYRRALCEFFPWVF